MDLFPRMQILPYFASIYFCGWWNFNNFTLTYFCGCQTFHVYLSSMVIAGKNIFLKLSKIFLPLFEIQSGKKQNCSY